MLACPFTLQKELEQAKCDQEIREKEAVTDRSSANDGDELIRLRDEVTVRVVFNDITRTYFN